MCVCVCKYSLIFDYNYLPKMIYFTNLNVADIGFYHALKSIPEHVLIKMCTEVGERDVECLHDF